MAAEKNYSFMGVKCQQDMSDHFVLQCLGVALLNNDYDADGDKKPVPTSCECDSDGALTMFLLNTQLIFGIVDNLFNGVNFLIWLIGLGTLLAGVIGVSNIMMVSVKERTTEIGIRRAIGAPPRQILGQIIVESTVLTLVSGMSGIVFSVLILYVVELGMTTDGILKAPFQIPFGTAVLAASLLTLLGVVAGLMPASRAMQIKPVDAMRDE